MTRRPSRNLRGLFAVALALATSPAALAVTKTPDIYQLYGAPNGPMTLVIGEGDPGPFIVGPLVTSFRDAGGVRVRVYSNRPVPMSEARASLANAREGRRRAEASRRRSREAGDDE